MMSNTTRPNAAGTDWVIVPREPTEAMLQTLHDKVRIECEPANLSASILNDQELWAAIIAAAPPARHLAASADVRRMALEEAAQVARQERRNRTSSAIFERGAVAASCNIENAIRALAGSPPSAPGYEPDGSSAPIASAPQPPEPAEDVAAVRADDYANPDSPANLKALLRTAEAALAEAKAEIETWRRTAERLAREFDGERAAAGSARAERDRPAGAAQSLDEAVGNSLDRDFAFWSGASSSREAVYPAWRDLRAVLSSLSAPEQPAEPSEDINDTIQKLVRDHDAYFAAWVEQLRTAIRDRASASLAAKGGE